jgi:hypothetical protein
LPQKLLLLLARFTRVVWKFAERPAKSRQHSPGVVEIKEIYERCVLALEKIDFQLTYEARDG